MACYHCSIKVIKRSEGRTVIAAAAYRAGERIVDERLGNVFDYSARKDVIFSQIYLPQNAPDEFRERAVLWNCAEKSEKRVDAQVAREIEVGLPNELSVHENKVLLYRFIQENFVSQGMIADVNYHEGKAKKRGEKNNPHAHILVSFRPVTKAGFAAKKNREWNSRQLAELWRENWADAQNREFVKKGLSTRVDHRSYERQGLDRVPTIHLGYAAAQMERKGKETQRGDYNRIATTYNKKMDITLDQLEKEVALLKRKIEQENEKAVFSSRRNAVLYDANRAREKTPPFVESRTKEDDIATMRNEYLSLEREKFLSLRAMRKIDQAIARQSSEKEDLLERRSIIDQFEGRIAQIEKYKRAVRGVNWEERRRLERAEKQIMQARAGALNSLNYDYEIRSIGEITAYLKRIEADLKSLKVQRAQLADLEMISKRQSEIEANYKQARAQNQQLTEAERRAEEMKLQKMNVNEQLALEAALKRLDRPEPDKRREKSKERGRGVDWD